MPAALPPGAAHWKSFSLQRGIVPPGEDEVGTAVDGRGGGYEERTTAVFETEEDVYGRCTNMKLTSFTEMSQVINLSLIHI